MKNYPNPGDEIYIKGMESYNGGGKINGIKGGLARVTKVILGEGSVYVEVSEVPGRVYRWDNDELGKMQKKLKKFFKGQRAQLIK